MSGGRLRGGAAAPVIDAVQGAFEATLAGTRRRFDTRLSTVAAMEAACGERPIVEVLNGIVTRRRAADQISLLAAALAAADPPGPAEVAGQATVGEAEAFLLALIFALGFAVGEAGEGRAGAAAPLGGSRNGGNGAPSPSAP